MPSCCSRPAVLCLRELSISITTSSRASTPRHIHVSGERRLVSHSGTVDENATVGIQLRLIARLDLEMESSIVLSAHGSFGQLNHVCSWTSLSVCGLTAQ
jgi:hypothetical protein